MIPDMNFNQLLDYSKLLENKIRELELSLRNQENSFSNSPANKYSSTGQLHKLSALIVKENVIIEVSQSLECILLYPKEALLGKPFTELATEDEKPSLIQKTFSDCDQIFSCELIKGDQSTEVFDLLVMPFASSLFDSKIVLIMYNKFFDSRFSLIQTLQSQNHALLNNIPYLAWIKSKEGLFISVNTNFLHYFKKETAEIIGKTDHVIWPDPIAEMLKQHETEVYTTGKQKCFIEHLSTKKDCDWFDIFLSPVFDENNQISGCTGIARNVSHRISIFGELMENTEKYNLVAENQSEYIVKLNRKGFVEFANPRFCKLVGLEEQKIIGNTMDQLIDPGKHGSFSDELEILKEPPHVHYNEHKTPTKEGWKWIAWADKALFDKNQQIVGFIGAGWDITDKKNIEETLLQTKIQKNTILESIPHIAWLKDKNRNYCTVNSAFLHSPLLKSYEIIGKSVKDIFQPEFAERQSRVDLEVLTSGKKVITEEALHWKNQLICFQIIRNPILDQNNQVIGIVGIAINISEQKRVEEKLRKENFDKLRFLSNSSLDILNSSIDNLYEYIGKKLKNIIPNSSIIVADFIESKNELKACYISSDSKYLNLLSGLTKFPTGEISLEVSDNLKTKLQNCNKGFYEFNDGLYEVFDSCIPLLLCRSIEKLMKIGKIYGMAITGEGKLFGTVILMTKSGTQPVELAISETFILQSSIAFCRKAVDKELIQAKEKALESDRLKSSFLSNMSHEIRTPLNGILGLSQLLDMYNLSATLRKEYINIIQSSGDKLLKIINNILDISYIQTHQLKVQKETFNIKSLLLSLHDQHLKILNYTGKKINFRLNLGMLNDNDGLFSDSDKIIQILSNFLDNAMKYTQKGYIELGFTLEKNEGNQFARFYVSDSGAGIPPRELEKIFQLFIQLDDSPSRHFGGSGLGLPIAQGLADLIDGQILVISEENKGSVFSLMLPFENIPSTSGNIHLFAKYGDSNWVNKTLLVIEDDRISFQLIQGILRKSKIQIIHALNENEAMEICRNNTKIDLILFNLPFYNTSSCQMIRCIKQMRPHLAIIAQVGNIPEEAISSFVDAGCDDFVAKPIIIKQLMDSIARFIMK
jgi:PAS domain S-box-containing protein